MHAPSSRFDDFDEGDQATRWVAATGATAIMSPSRSGGSFTQRVDEHLRSDLVARPGADVAEEHFAARSDHQCTALLPRIALGPALMESALPGLEVGQPAARAQRQQGAPLEARRRVALQGRIGEQ